MAAKETIPAAATGAHPKVSPRHACSTSDDISDEHVMKCLAAAVKKERLTDIITSDPGDQENRFIFKGVNVSKIAREDYKNYKAEIMAMVKLWPTSVVAAGRLTQPFHLLDKDYNFKLSKKDTKKERIAWAEDQATILHSMIAFCRRRWRDAPKSAADQERSLKIMIRINIRVIVILTIRRTIMRRRRMK